MKSNSDTNNSCWICGDKATTGEHTAKNKSLKATFGENSKLLLHYEDGRIKIAQSTNSNHLKSGKILCRYCNSTRTQPFDRTYDKFIEILVANKNTIINNKFISLTKLTK